MPRGFRLRRRGLLTLVLALGCVGAYVVASRSGVLDRIRAHLLARPGRSIPLAAGDFPAGVSAPVGNLAAIPLRPTLVGFVPRGTSASLLLAAGGASPSVSAALASHPSPSAGKGLFKKAYALDVRAVAFSDETALRRALLRGGDKGGVDMALLSVDRLAESYPALRNASPRVELLVGRSQGNVALAAVGLKHLGDLRGKRVAVDRDSPGAYFALWLLSRVGLSASQIRWVSLASPSQAAEALREGKADAVVGPYGAVAKAAKDRGGAVLSTTADAPHLLAQVLVSRGDFAARYPDAVNRILRGLLDAGAEVSRHPLPAARELGDIAPNLGDPREAIRRASPASLADNLAFFGVSGTAPVTYAELFRSASALFVRLGRVKHAPPPERTRDLAPLRAVAEVKGR